MLRQWLSKTPKKVCLPDSDKQRTPEKQKLCDDLNEIVDAMYRSKTHTPSKKRKRGEYGHYSPQLNFRKRKATKGVKHLPEDFEKKQT